MIPHYVTHNATTRVPRRFVFLDSEAHIAREGAGTVQTFRLAVTAYDRFDLPAGKSRATEWKTHDTPESVWDHVEAAARKRTRLVVVAHNLGYDLRITKAFQILCARGWQLGRVSIVDRAVTAVMTKDTASINLVDSMAWLPMGLARIGGMVKIAKPDLPTDDDSDDAWLARCRADVEILRAAYLDLIDWVQEDDLGNWQKTGASQASNHWRHSHMTHKVLVNPDERWREGEAAAAYTGRCEALAHGHQPARAYVEWDMPLCYPRIAADVDLPSMLVAIKNRPRWSQLENMMSERRVLVYATVATQVPALPVKTPNGTIWPVGTFEGWWWDVEVQNAVTLGATVKVDRAQIYRKDPVLRSWANWVIDAVENPKTLKTEVRRAAAKHMARALIGRFGSKYTPWHPYMAAIEPGVEMVPIVDIDEGTTGKCLTIGNDTWVGWEQRYSDNAIPSIMSVIMAEARVRLWCLIEAAGLNNVLYVDTDSLIVTSKGDKRMRDLSVQGLGWGVRPKRKLVDLTILGPRQLTVGHEHRITGVPKSAELVGKHEYLGEMWESFETALKRGHQDAVHVSERVWKVKGVDNRRIHLPGGKTAPFALVDGELVEDLPKSAPKAG